MGGYMKILKKFIALFFFVSVGFITGVIYATPENLLAINKTIETIPKENQDKCEVTWIAAVAQSEPTTFWTLQTDECLSRFGYINTRELNKIEEFKTDLTSELKNEIYRKNEDDVTFRIKNLNYFVAHVLEKDCSEEYLKNKLNKLNEYVKVSLETNECLGKDMLSDLENFVKEYK